MGLGTIEIKYRDHRVERLCTDYRQAKKELNVRVADKLYSLLDTLKMGNNLQEIFDLKMYYLHPLKGNREGEFALDLGRRTGYRLVIVPLDDHGNRWEVFDLKKVFCSTRIVLVWEVTNHYE